MPGFDKAATAQTNPASTERGGKRPPIAGLGPHGERPTSAKLVQISPEMLEQARHRSFRVAIVLHTTTSDWSKRQVAGIGSLLEEAGAVVTDIIDCAYDAEIQVAAIERIVATRPDALIAIPIGNSAVTAAFRSVSAAGIKLILLDNALSGLLPETDYVSMVSSDNFGLGQIAAELLVPHIPQEGTVGVLSYNVDFFATAQREIAFGKWMRQARPDIAIDQVKFRSLAEARDLIAPYLDRPRRLDGLFVVWDEPAMAILPTLAARSTTPVMTTVDLGAGIADALRDGRVVCGVAAQQPFRQGVLAATSAILALLGNDVPPWIVLPGLAVTRDNVAGVYETVGGSPPSPHLSTGKSIC